MEEDSLEYKSYEEWDAEGCYVIKGEKSHKRDEDGTCLFSEDQVDDYEGNHFLSIFDIY